MFALLPSLGFALLGDDLKGFAGGGQRDQHTREVLLETDRRHIDVLRRDLDSPTDAAGALGGQPTATGDASSPCVPNWKA
jgi:hypothetical protein